MSKREDEMARTATIFTAVVALMVLLSAGAVLAASPIIGTDRSEQIIGTRDAEEIRGLGGEDEIIDGLGRDVVVGGKGADNLIGYGGETPVGRLYRGTGKGTHQAGGVS